MAAILVAMLSLYACATPELASSQAPWLTFEMVESFAADSGFTKRHTTMTLDRDGSYSVEETVELAEDSAPSVRSRRGRMADSQLDFLRKGLNSVAFDALDAQTFQVGYSDSVQPGWSGLISYSHGGAMRTVGFSSKKPPLGQDRTVSMNRLATLVFYIKRLAEHELARVP